MRKADHSGESLRVDAFEQLTSRFIETTYSLNVRGLYHETSSGQGAKGPAQ